MPSWERIATLFVEKEFAGWYCLRTLLCGDCFLHQSVALCAVYEHAFHLPKNVRCVKMPVASTVSLCKPSGLCMHLSFGRWRRFQRRISVQTLLPPRSSSTFNTSPSREAQSTSLSCREAHTPCPGVCLCQTSPSLGCLAVRTDLCEAFNRQAIEREKAISLYHSRIMGRRVRGNETHAHAVF